MDERKKFHIVIIGAAATFNSDGSTNPGFMPAIDDIKNTVILASKNSLDLSFSIIDENLNYALRLASDKTSRKGEHILLDAYRIKYYPQRVKCYLIPPWELKDITHDEISIKDAPYPVIYLSYKDNSSYEIMNSIASYNLNNRWFVISRQRISMNQLISDYISLQNNEASSILLPNSIYDLYSGNTMKNLNYEYDLLEVKKQIFWGCIIVDEYLRAGYNLDENKTDVMGWCLNSETPFIKGLCYTYGLITPIPDKNNSIELRQNSGFRRQLWNLAARVISSFSVNNNLITSQEAIEYGGWYDRRIYSLIKSRTDGFTGNVFSISEIKEEHENVSPLPELKVPTLEEIFGSLETNKTLPSSGTKDVTIHLP